MRSKEFTESESYQPPELHTGDKILKGKFKNSPAEIKGFKKDKHNQPVLKTNKGDVQLFKPRVVKIMPEGLDFNKLHSDPSQLNQKSINFNSIRSDGKGGVGYAEFNDGTVLNQDQLEMLVKDFPKYGTITWDMIDPNSVEVAGVNRQDYPEFCDAFFSAANWKGTGIPLTDDELDKLSVDCGEELNYAAHDRYRY
jgi:hypothetical protein